MVQKKRIKLTDFKFCTGCMSCFSSCPKKAITAKSKYGFYYPQINKTKCIKCGICVKSCPIVTGNVVQNEIKKVYSAQAKEISWRLKCSSGGIFGLISSFAYNNDYVIYGVAYNKNNREANHLSSDEVDLLEFYGSKYVQCSGDNKFLQVKQDLEKGRNVLYSGCPCEIAGLLSFLGTKYDNLLTIDFICHGVPSPTFFKKVIEKESKRNNVSLVKFREKDSSFPSLITTLYYEDGTKTIYNSFDFYYFRLFHDNICLRRSCYNCSIQSKHLADITLGDDWEASDKDNLGKSLVIVNTNKGETAFNKVIELCDENIVIKSTDSLSKRIFTHKYKKIGYRTFRFFRLYNHPVCAKSFFKIYKPMKKLKDKTFERIAILKNRILKK